LRSAITSGYIALRDATFTQIDLHSSVSVTARMELAFRGVEPADRGPAGIQCTVTGGKNFHADRTLLTPAPPGLPYRISLASGFCDWAIKSIARASPDICRIGRSSLKLRYAVETTRY
jgi:hypothetical protein